MHSLVYGNISNTYQYSLTNTNKYGHGLGNFYIRIGTQKKIKWKRDKNFEKKT